MHTVVSLEEERGVHRLVIGQTQSQINLIDL